MPAKNVRKNYIKDGYYHLYNRGVEKRKIFLDAQDYSVFSSYLNVYLSPKNNAELRNKIADPKIPWTEKDKILKQLRLNNFSDDITLIAYCLMPNHFHFFIKQKNADSIDKFMNSLCTRYSMYFNKKYKRVGSLYQGTYKAVSIENESQFLHLTRYIHKQALDLQGVALQAQPSSYKNFIGMDHISWVHPEEILTYFSKTNPSLSYKAFVEQKDDIQLLDNLTLDED